MHMYTTAFVPIFFCLLGYAWRYHTAGSNLRHGVRFLYMFRIPQNIIPLRRVYGYITVAVYVHQLVSEGVHNL